MRFSHFINIICVALIAGYIGTRIQKKKDLCETEVAPSEFPKRRNKGIQPEYIFQSRIEARETLDALFTMIDQYGVGTIADLLELIDEPSTFRDSQFGWTDLKDASIKRIREGYLLDLPAAALLH